MIERSISSIVVALFICSAGTAFSPLENIHGIGWTAATVESWSGSVQSSPFNGTLVHLAGSFDTSVDAVNSRGDAVFLGLLPPIREPGPGSPTPTETATATPTLTPGGPTPTPTTCMAAANDADFDLDGVNGVDARDLLLLCAALGDQEQNPYDFNCDGRTDAWDLLQFSEHWGGVEGP